MRSNYLFNYAIIMAIFFSSWDRNFALLQIGCRWRCVRLLSSTPKPSNGIHVSIKNKTVEDSKPFKLPPGNFRPKQSLGQNFLNDQNIILKIVDAFAQYNPESKRVVEIGPGIGALTKVLYQRYPDMTAVEIDQRSVAFLGNNLQGLDVVHKDVLLFDWESQAALKQGKLSIIANLPYYIVSQVLFSLADAHKAIDRAVVTTQWEVAERITASPSSKQYGIPSVVFQLYGEAKLLFKIPPKAFYPVPKVDSGLISIDFTKPHPMLHEVDGHKLRRILSNSFQHRRKMLRQSLKEVLLKDGVQLPARWATARPEELTPEQFLQMTVDIYGPFSGATCVAMDGSSSIAPDNLMRNQAVKGNSVETTSCRGIVAGIVSSASVPSRGSTPYEQGASVWRTAAVKRKL